MTIETPSTETVKDDNRRIVSAIGRLTAALVAFLAVAAFGLSFEALRDLAIVAGGMKPAVAWLFPLIVDGGIIVFSLAALRASITGADRRWFMWLVVIVTVISVGLNIAHAGRGLVPAVIGAMPPILLFLAFESLMRQVHDTVTPAAPKKLVAGKSKKPVPLLRVEVEASNQDRVEKVLAMFQQGASRNQIARELSIAPSTVRRCLAKSQAA